MTLFSRTLRLFFFLIGLGVGLMAAIIALLTRQMVNPSRQRLWTNPKDVGLAYEDVQFPARDGARVSGWFIPGSAVDADREPGKRPTILLVHSWMWNRLGNSAESMLDNMSGALPVDVLRLTHALHRAGYNTLMFDLRNHGLSASVPPTTFGLQEANDLLGAVDYVAQRSDVDVQRIGAIGFSVGANAILFSLQHTSQLNAAVLVQPASPSSFADRFSADLLGPLGAPVIMLAETAYRVFGGLPMRTIRPIDAAAGAGKTPLLYVQSNRDRWGSLDDVADMVAATPKASPPVYIDAGHRFTGYQYIINQPHVCIDFFNAQFAS